MIQEVDDVLFRARPSLLALLSWMVWTGLIVGLSGWLLIFPIESLLGRLPGFQLTESQINVTLRFVEYTALGIAGFSVLVLLCKVAALKSIYYEVTQDRIEWSRGILNRKIDNIDMYQSD